jgi:hypothetical protein
MRALICGGRDFTDSRKFMRCMDQMNEQYGPFSCIIQGGARGADRLAAGLADHLMVECEEYPADWTTHGRAAGPIRNQQMLAEGRPDIVFAFEGGRGTASMVSLAKAAGVRVVEF